MASSPLPSPMAFNPKIHAPIPMRSSSAAATTTTTGPPSTKQRSGNNKRRSIDPEETGSVAATTPYDGERPRAKRARTIDDVLGSLSLRAPDPPAHSHCAKRKSGGAGDEDGEAGRSPKAARSSGAFASAASMMSDASKTGDGSGLEPAGRKGGSPTNVTSELVNSSMQQQRHRQLITSYAQPMPETSASASAINAMMGDNNEMAIEDSDHESDNSSVSESSIKNAMYQLVFGRKNVPQPPLAGTTGNHGKYDSVDSKIEDLIRRSRLEASIKSRKEESGDATNNNNMATDDIMDTEGDNSDGDEGWDTDGDVKWNPGHG